MITFAKTFTTLFMTKVEIAIIYSFTMGNTMMFGLILNCYRHHYAYGADDDIICRLPQKGLIV